MPSCYKCGQTIKRGEGVRRKVQTGSSLGIFSSGVTGSKKTRKGGGYRRYYGVRTLCKSCAGAQDLRKSGCGCLIFLFAAFLFLAECMTWESDGQPDSPNLDDTVLSEQDATAEDHDIGSDGDVNK